MLRGYCLDRYGRLNIRTQFVVSIAVSRVLEHGSGERSVVTYVEMEAIHPVPHFFGHPADIRADNGLSGAECLVNYERGVFPPDGWHYDPVHAPHQSRQLTGLVRPVELYGGSVSL